MIGSQCMLTTFSCLYWYRFHISCIKEHSSCAEIEKEKELFLKLKEIRFHIMKAWFLVLLHISM
jgi:hypothetical protein